MLTTEKMNRIAARKLGAVEVSDIPPSPWMEDDPVWPVALLMFPDDIPEEGLLAEKMTAGMMLLDDRKVGYGGPDYGRNLEEMRKVEKSLTKNEWEAYEKNLGRIARRDARQYPCESSATHASARQRLECYLRTFQLITDED